ncbi:MAG: TIR domain-containing protein [Opitutaceae bacterium]|nr:TIR domain-containing protein [Opitutaceae bacterium]
MPIEPSRAVFLSYASQDADAAARICTALRAAGIEVWFDRNELAGGDAWDAKIRRQIAECTLFVPVISTATQARLEGYFRIEWKLAARRTHAMATAKAFLLPVVIDATHDAEAHVPDEFREVQWTRLPGGETPGKFCERVKTLLVGPGLEAGPSDHRKHGESTVSSAQASPGTSRRVPSAAWIAAAAAVAAGALYFALRPAPNASAGALPSAAGNPAAPSGKAQQLVARARALYEPWDFASADDFKLADRLLKEATDLEPLNADAWAALAIQSYGQHAFGFDRSDARDDQLRRAADRAAKLTPESDRAKLALALHYRRSPGNDDETLRLLRELAERHPTDKFILRQLASAFGAKGRHDECLAAYDRALALPGGDAIARMGRATKLMDLRRLDEAEAAIEQALAARPDYWLAHIMRAALLLQFHGQIDATKAALQRIPARVMKDERVAAVAGYLWLMLRDADKASEALRYVTQDYVDSNVVQTPKALLAGLVHQLAGRRDAAMAEWRAALRVIELRFVSNLTSLGYLSDKAILQALLGERAAAEETLRTYEQLRRLPAGRANGATWTIYAALGREAEVADFFSERLKGKPADLPLYNAALLRVHPALDAFRGKPRFQALIAEADNLLAAAPRRGVRLGDPAK